MEGNALRAEQCSAGEIPVKVKQETGGQNISGHQYHTCRFLRPEDFKISM